MAGISWLHLLTLGLIVLVVAAVAVWAVRAWRRRGVDPLIGLTLSLSALWTLTAALAAAGALITTLTSREVQITVPVSTYWPQAPSGVEIQSGPTAAVEGGGFSEASLLLSGLSTAARLAWGIGTATGWLVSAALAALIALSCFQLLAGRAFTAVVSRTAAVTAAVVLVGGLGSQILCGIGGSMASAEALTVTAARADGAGDGSDPMAWHPVPTFAVQLDFWPIGAALALAALAALLRYGSRLQQETELLV